MSAPQEITARTLDDLRIVLSPAVLEMLQREGIVIDTPQGLQCTRDAAGVTAAVKAHPELLTCDFCGRSPVAFYHPVRPVERSVPGASTPDRAVRATIRSYATCAPCAELVRMGRRNDLVQRSASARALRDGLSSSDVSTLLAALHKAVGDFWETRSGDPVPAGERPPRVSGHPPA